MPKATIVVPSRGGAKRLPTLFAALRNQDEKDFDVIVVLDGDIDDSESVVAAEAARGVVTVRSIVFAENRGRVSALNAGFDAADGAVLIRCDDDFEPHPNYVARHVELHQDVVRGVVGVAENIFDDTPYARAYGLQADEQFHAAAAAVADDQAWRFWAGNVSVRAETYALVGPYDADYRAYGWEDVDWGYRLHEAGIPILVDAELSTPHHLASVTAAIRARRAYQSAAAKKLFDAKHPEANQSQTVPHSPWNTAVRAVSFLPPAASLALASQVDRVLPKLPSKIGEKAVALVVEGCALGGARQASYEDRSI